jgi:hypothetical protein
MVVMVLNLGQVAVEVVQVVLEQTHNLNPLKLVVVMVAMELEQKLLLNLIQQLQALEHQGQLQLKDFFLVVVELEPRLLLVVDLQGQEDLVVVELEKILHQEVDLNVE